MNNEKEEVGFMINIIAVTLVMVFTGLVSEQDSSEKNAVKTPLRIYSGGLSWDQPCQSTRSLEESEQFCHYRL